MPKKPTVRAERITDKERLDWLEGNSFRLEKVSAGTDRFPHWSCIYWAGKYGHIKEVFGRDARAAIDAAIRYERRKPKGRKPQ